MPGIAAIIEPQDFLSDNPDEVGIITYVMQIYFKIVSLQVPLVARLRKKQKKKKLLDALQSADYVSTAGESPQSSPRDQLEDDCDDANDGTAEGDEEVVRYGRCIFPSLRLHLNGFFLPAV